jgi:hypothetical protein
MIPQLFNSSSASRAPHVRPGARLQSQTVRARGGRGFLACVVVLAGCLASTSCSTPGVEVDQSGLDASPIGKQVAALYPVGDDDFATRHLNRWLDETCPVSNAQTARDCGRQLGMRCADQASTDGSVSCEYSGRVRARSISYRGQPSISSASTSDWWEADITVRLTYPADRGSLMTYGTKVLGR